MRVRVINDKEYSSDVIVFPDRVQSDWWRNKGHDLALQDITEVITENPEVLVVGTGASELMKVLPEVKREAKALNITIITQPTSEACDIYNELRHSQKVVAALHPTC